MLLQAFGAGLKSESAFKISNWSRSEKLATPLHFSVGAEPLAANNFLRISHKKTLILAHFFVEKGHAVSALIMDNAKIFLQKLQPLLV